MADSTQDQSEKTEKATPHKLREARKQGNVAKSTEVNTAFAVITGLIFLISLGDVFIHSVISICREMLVSAGSVHRVSLSSTYILDQWLISGMNVLSPLVCMLLVSGVLASLVQTGVLFTVHPLKPNITRLNPITGFKNKFSQRFLWDIVKTLLKFVVLSTIAIYTAYPLIATMMKYSSLSVGDMLEGFLGASSTMLARLAIALCIIAVLDFLYTRWEYLRKQRMSQRELKDEVKRRDGDPHIRAKRKELESELRKRSASLSKVPSADVVITNPTRFAIALSFDSKTMVAPTIVGMGSGRMAQLMRESAVNHRVPIVRMPRLARRLYKVGQIDRAIPQECYAATATALHEAYSIRDAAVRARL